MGAGSRRFGSQQQGQTVLSARTGYPAVFNPNFIPTSGPIVSPTFGPTFGPMTGNRSARAARPRACRPRASRLADSDQTVRKVVRPFHEGAPCLAPMPGFGARLRG